MFITLIFLLLCAVWSSVSAVSENVTVETKKGTIVGFKNDGYNVFFGVPYAKVDEGNPFGVSDLLLLGIIVDRKGLVIKIFFLIDVSPR